MHKEEAEWLKEEIILEIMGNQEESQRGRGLNLEDWEIVGAMGNKGIRRHFFFIEKNNEGDKPQGNKKANVVSKKSEEDALLLSL